MDSTAVYETARSLGSIPLWATMKINKKCSICKEDKPFDSFHKDKKSKDGHFGYCKPCRKNNDAKYYRTSNKQEISYARRHKMRAIITRYKRFKGCCNCNEGHPCCLDFHHLRDKLFVIALASDYGWTVVKEEIRKCVVICANCHRKLHAGIIRIGK